MATKKTNRSKSGTTKRKTSTTRRRSGTRKTTATAKRRTTRRNSSSGSSSSRGTSNMSAMLSGAFDGDITTNSHMHFASNCRCRGNVQAPSCQIDGEMNGKVVAPKKVGLGAKAQVRGEIVTDTIVASPGAAFDGRCKLGRLRKAA